ncbi:MAG: DUF4080 domain-containing protein, partial [Bacillota bacterium]|nr:DUF4080 domain-containing protein [Bacillota bacterium]
LKKALPDALILLGGPEAGMEPSAMLERYGFIDYVISGAGEEPLKNLLDSLENNKEPYAEGIWSRNECFGGYAMAPIDSPMPYSLDDITNCKNKILYYEASRGFYNKCAYCLSSVDKCMYYDIEKVKKELLFMSEHGAKLIKLIDRSFNADKKRAKELFAFLSKNTQDTKFHFEIAPDIFDEEMFSVLSSVPKGKFQFEAGIQSLNIKTLEAINRKTDIDKALDNIRKIKSLGNIEIHVDIIAGLPYEDLESFIKTFNGVYDLKADMLSLGFLKLLKGTEIRKRAEEFEIVYNSFPPYEVIRTSCISPFELSLLKGVEEALERLYNSGAFKNTIAKLEKKYPSPFDLYKDLSKAFSPGEPRSSIYSKLLCKYGKELKESLILDFMASGEKKPPQGFEPIISDDFRNRCFEFIEKYTDEIFPEYKELPYKELHKKLTFYAFDCGTYVADKAGGVSLNITERF